MLHVPEGTGVAGSFGVARADSRAFAGTLCEHDEVSADPGRWRGLRKTGCGALRIGVLDFNGSGAWLTVEREISGNLQKPRTVAAPWHGVAGMNSI
jgi:hypothetical protein